MDKEIEKKRWPIWRILWFIFIAGAVVLFVSTVYQEKGAARLNIKTERLLVDTVARGVFQEFISISGVVQPIRTVLLDAVEGGRVEEILIEDGVKITRSQAILRLSNDDLQREYLNLESQLISQINQIRSLSIVQEQQSLNLKEQALDADYQVDQLIKKYDRNKSLFQDSVIAASEWEKIEDEYEYQIKRRAMLDLSMEKDSISNDFQREQMKSSLDLMRRNLEFAQKSLDNLIVKAPIDGQLSSFSKEIGQLISRGQNIAQIDDLSSYRIVADIDEFYSSRIFTGQTGTFSLDGESYELRIKKVYPDVVNGTFAVDMVFSGTLPPSIKRGQSLSIKLALSSEDEAVLLAKGGFYQTTGGNWAYVIDPEEAVAYKREIIIHRQNPDFYEITGGLEPGDVVIISSYENFGDKQELLLR